MKQYPARIKWHAKDGWKLCKGCQQRKQISEFARCNGNYDGFTSRCSPCTTERTRSYRNQNRANLNAVQKRCRERNKAERPLVYYAGVKLRNAVRKGDIIRPDTCAKCGRKGPVHGHHWNYNFPLSVIWLCPKCHSNVHGALYYKFVAIP